MEDDKAGKNLPASVDKGPCELQTMSALQEDLQDASEVETVLGVLPSIAPHLPKKKDAEVINTLNDGLNQHNKKKQTAVQFPYASPIPINEYDEENSLFTRAFPCIFPGGLGDFGQFRDKKMNVADWARNILYYEDGRFAKDRIWYFLHWILSQGKRIK